MQRFIDLFAGIGGFHVALRQRGMDCVFASEIDKDATRAYAVNFGQIPRGDICQIANHDIPPHDVLCAGFPCQPFSRSGKREGLNDGRGRLFYEIVRIAKHHKPSLLILENVKTILTIDNGEVRREIYKQIEGEGYRLEHVVLNASNFGVPQKRERAYFVGIREDLPWDFIKPQPTKKIKYLKDIILPDKFTVSMSVHRDDIVYDKDETNPPPEARPLRIGYLNKGGQGERIYSINGHAITLSANGGGVGNRTGLYLVNDNVRRLHIDEAKQVMGFSKRHVVSRGTAGYRQLGNAVIPSMIGQIYDGVRMAA